ncbi:MAG: hypothetical protein ACR2JR_03150, partial [Rubrobacteraceae bacterium]
MKSEDGSLRIPIQYNHLLQGLIYTNLDHALSEWLHEKGHAYGQRRFKLFTFSRLFGKREMRNGRVRFDGPTHFYLSAVNSEVLGSFAEHLLTKPAVRLGSAHCRVAEVGVEPEPEIAANKSVVVKALWPDPVFCTRCYESVSIDSSSSGFPAFSTFLSRRSAAAANSAG